MASTSVPAAVPGRAPTPTPAPAPAPESFIGSHVKVIMTTGIVAVGTVAQVNPGSAEAALTLHDVSASFNGSTTHVAAVDIPGQTIKDLTIIQSKPQPFVDPAILSFTPAAGHLSSSHPPPRQFTIPTPTSSTNGSRRPPVETCEEDGSSSTTTSSESGDNQKARRSLSGATASYHQRPAPHATHQHNHRAGSGAAAKTGTPTKSNPHYHRAARPQRQQQQQQQHLRAGGRAGNPKDKDSTWDLGDISDYHTHEFDFQAGLDRFDKQRVFEEIAKTDTVAPEDRLVSINRRTPPTIAKLKHTENVLPSPSSSAPKPPASTASSTPASSSSSSSSTRRASSSLHSLPAIPMGRTRTLYGHALPSATPLQMVQAERVAAQDAGLPESVLTENAGRSVAMMVLQALGGNRRFAAAAGTGAAGNREAHVMVLCGDNGTGAVAACAARHVANRGARVSVVVAADEYALGVSGIGAQVKMLRAIAAAAHTPRGGDGGGVALYTSAEDLPAHVAVDLIVDGLLGMYSLRELGHPDVCARVCDLMAWANAHRAPVLSLDVPSGLDAATGQVPFPPHCVRPQWTLCLGIPKAGVVDRKRTGEVFLADVGMPGFVWGRVGVVGWPAGAKVWEDKFVVGLEYVENGEMEEKARAKRKSAASSGGGGGKGKAA